MRIIGYRTSKGEYQGHDYDNVLVYVIDKVNSNGFGEYGSYLKVKRDTLPINLNDLLGASIIDVNYDKYGKVKDLKIEY